ncbi:MAG: 2' O-ribose methyltransferase [Sclerophora amabilis]|nr:MAG: 2' O-ribose methyltransferase [Sclerophora amabilis]
MLLQRGLLAATHSIFSRPYARSSPLIRQVGVQSLSLWSLDRALPGKVDIRSASSASSKRWQSRQGTDRYAREARVQGLKSRAAFKLLEIHERYRIFKKGQTVVDLGYAPGSWSQVAVDRTSPNGRVLGIDIIPAEPPKGVSTIQGNFLSPTVREEVRRFLRDTQTGKPQIQQRASDAEGNVGVITREGANLGHSYLDLERRSLSSDPPTTGGSPGQIELAARTEKKEKRGEKMVDVVLSDMCEPWDQVNGFHSRSISDPYFRMMNTTGLPFRDHAGSMDLCAAALQFCVRALRPNGSFVCKYYAGAEDRTLHTRLKRLFEKVHREKPESSRRESREAYFVALKRRQGVEEDEVFAD